MEPYRPVETMLRTAREMSPKRGSWRRNGGVHQTAALPWHLDFRRYVARNLWEVRL